MVLKPQLGGVQNRFLDVLFGKDLGKLLEQISPGDSMQHFDPQLKVT